MSQPFTTLPLKPALLQTLQDLNLTEMTEIQAGSLPLILKGKDVLAKSKTGSGKTVAFSLGLLQRFAREETATQALVLCPTRELAEQVASEIRRLGRQIENLKVLTLCGGTPMGPQISSLSHGADVVVGTPGRVMDHLLKGRLQIADCQCLVLDEADRMLDMGFAKELDTVIARLPTDRQTLLFSATYPEAIRQISARVQRSPQEITVEATHDTRHIAQSLYEIDDAHRGKATAALLSHHQPASSIVFSNTKAGCQALADELAELGFSVLALHGDLEQKQRTEVLIRFANRSVRVLVATDVAARGLDIDDVALVINSQPAFEPDVHVHRIGRTGRAGASGLAITLCAPKDAGLMADIEAYLEQKLPWKSIHSVRFHANRIQPPEYETLALDGGKKQKLRPGDILGALTKDADVPGEDVGKIKMTATHTYVAVKTRSVKRSLRHFADGKIKGKKFRARKLK